MWIEPATFAPATGQIVGIRLKVGQDLLGDPIPRSSALIRDFVALDSEGRKPVVGREGSDPAGFARATGPGLMILGYSSNPSSVELPVEKFRQYLKEEGLEKRIAVREERAQKEQFSRCAKSLLLSGAASASEGDRALGFTLELVAERNPYLLGAGEELPLRLTYLGRPLAGALVVAMTRAGEKISARTDAAGRVRLKVARNGFWMIKAVHMISAPAGSGADWSSYWASLTFERRPS